MSDACASYYDGEGCLVTPECPAVEAVPEHIDRSPIVGWTAGALSAHVETGDASLRFQMPAGVVGVVIGFKPNGLRPTTPSLVQHGFYFQRALGDYFQIIERGVTKTALRPRAATDQFEVRRVAGIVTYWQNGRLVYQSETSSTGLVLANCCMYSSGDAVPARFDPDAPAASNPIVAGYTDVAFAVNEQGTTSGTAGGQMVAVGLGSSATVDMSQQTFVQAVGVYNVWGDMDGHVHVDIDASSSPVTADMYALLDFADHASVTVKSYISAGIVFATIGENYYPSDQYVPGGYLDAAPGGNGGFSQGGVPSYVGKSVGADGTATFTRAELTDAGFFDYLAAHASDSPPPRVLVGAYQHASNGDVGLDLVFTVT